MGKTNVEYMSEPARAERTVRRFMELTLHEMKAVQLKNRNYAEWCTDDVISTEKLDREKAETMSYMDIICFLYNISADDRYKGTRTVDCTECPSDVRGDFTYKMLARLLLDAERKSIPIRLFMALPLKAFYDCLERISGEALLYRECQVICCEYTRLRELLSFEMAKADGALIKDVLRLCNSITCMPWVPTQMSSENYRTKIMCAHRLLERLLVKSFKLTFPEQFCIDRVRTRYAQKHKTA